MITIQDNNYQGKVCSLHDTTDLLSIGNKPIRQLCEENEHLLVFPLSIDDTDDRIGESTIVDIYAEDENSVRIKSGNIMGFVGRKNQQLKIYSRFDNKKHDFFLHYMLQKVFSFNIFNLDFTSSEDHVFEFLVYMFPAILKKAMRQGIYKEYRRFRHNDANVRGTIDISRHIKENIPFRETVAYNTREFSFDNSVTELIRHTIEYIKTIPSGDIILSSDKTVEDCIKKIVSYTHSYNHTEKIKVIQDNLRPRIHPFYKEYTALQKLCIQISSFWKQDIVLDAKYKKLAINGNRLDIERDDVHQIMAYMYRLKAPKGGIICPFMGDDNKIIFQNMHKDSYLGTMYLYALAIPRDCISYEEFVKRIAEKENALLKETS